MKKIEYHKLVRDRIPEIIEKDGKTCVCSELSQEDYIIMLDQKLNEELAEYQESKSMEGLGKKEKRGGFEKKILLETVIDQEN